MQYNLIVKDTHATTAKLRVEEKLGIGATIDSCRRMGDNHFEYLVGVTAESDSRAVRWLNEWFVQDMALEAPFPVGSLLFWCRAPQLVETVAW